MPKIFSNADRALAARIEAAEAATALALATALRQSNPKIAAAAEPAMGGGYESWAIPRGRIMRELS